MIKAMAVTGFLGDKAGFPGKKMPVEQMRELGTRLKNAIPGKIHAFDDEEALRDCWAWPLARENPFLAPSCANPPTDRFDIPRHMAYSNILRLQRYEWMRRAGELYPDVDVFAWIEYTVLKQPGVTEHVIQDFMAALEEAEFDALSAPGCWSKGPVDDSKAHWRFVGSCWVCPRQYLEKLFEAARTVVTLRTRMTGKISWDMNTMAYIELLDILPIRWYPAGHDQTQFTNYCERGVNRTLTPLCELAKKYQTDKGGWHVMYGGVVGTTCHNYTPAYYELFKDRREKVKRVLEIGVHTGSSLRMWEEFFPNAKVYGFDNNRHCIFSDGRIQCFVADQANPQSLLDAVSAAGAEPFDLIIDDGSHEAPHQVTSANTLLRFVAKDGYYIIEDIKIDCKPELVSKDITVPSAEFEMTYLKTGRGIGVAHCDSDCSYCQGSEGECLIVYHRR